MPDPGVIRDNKARNNYAGFANFLGGGSKPKISTNTPANKIQSNQFTAGHQMDPGQKARTSIPGLKANIARPGANTTADRNLMNQARRSTTTGAGTPMGADRAMMNSASRATKTGLGNRADQAMLNSASRIPTTRTPTAADRAMMNSAAAGAAGGLGAIDWAEVQKRMNAAASADKKFMPQLPSSTGSTASSYDMGVPNNTNLFGYDPTPAATVQDSAPSMWAQNQQMPAFESPEWDSMEAMVEKEFGPNQDIYNPTYDEERFPTIVPPVALEEALAVQPAPVMPPAGDTGGGAYDYGGSGFGGGTGNLGTFDPFASDEYLRFGSELAGLENQEGMIDESRGFWDISQDRKWDEVMRQIPGLFNQRGMADSGLLNRANALALGDREFETAVRDWMDENQRSAINRGQMAAEQELMRSQLQNMFDMFGSGAITPMNQPTMNQMDPMGVFNQTADAIAQGPRNYYGTNPTMDQLNAFNTGTAGMSADQKDALSRLFASKAGAI